MQMQRGLAAVKRAKHHSIVLALAFCVVASAGCGSFRLQHPPGDGGNTSTSVTGAYGTETNCNGTVAVAGVPRIMTIIVARANTAVVDTTRNPLYQGYVLYDATQSPSALSLGMKADQDAVTYPKHYTPILTLGAGAQADGTLIDISVAANSVGTIQFWSSGAAQTVSLLCHLGGT